MLYWPDVANETSYDIWRWVHNTESQFWPFHTNTQNDNDYINSWIPEGYKVSYKVRAENDDGYSAWSPVATRHVSGRNDGQTLRVEAIKFSTAALNAVESWVSGAPEIRLRVVRGSSSGATTVFTSGIIEPPRRSNVLNQFWHCQTWVANWYTSAIGTVLTFDWREEDPISKVTYSINGSWEDPFDWGGVKIGGSVQITQDLGNDHIGTNLVYHWEPKNYWYNITGFVYFFSQ
jgi:hypothetical protein